MFGPRRMNAGARFVARQQHMDRLLHCPGDKNPPARSLARSPAREAAAMARRGADGCR
jgi:hypothetical protein